MRHSAHENSPDRNNPLSAIKKSPNKDGLYDRPWRAAHVKSSSKKGGSILLGDRQSEFTGNISTPSQYKLPNSSGKIGVNPDGFSQRSIERGQSPTTTLGNNLPGSKSTNIRIKRKFEDMKSPDQSVL